MRRADKKRPIVILGITTVAVFMAGTFFCAGSVLKTFGKEQITEGRSTEEKKAYHADSKTTGSRAIEIATPSDTTLNQEEKTSKLSASKQSSLEMAIDELIELTESDG